MGSAAAAAAEGGGGGGGGGVAVESQPGLTLLDWPLGAPV